MAERENNREEITFEIKEHIAVINTSETGWTREVNLVSWNGTKPKVDVREWDPDHQRMSRGITLTETEAEKFARAIGQRMLEKQKAAQAKESHER
ncbi:MAG: hypothetical protein IJJ01_00135 [Firmicutes bacterium]|nr:hypothetical protein [Bacillota bacterium]